MRQSFVRFYIYILPFTFDIYIDVLSSRAYKEKRACNYNINGRGLMFIARALTSLVFTLSIVGSWLNIAYPACWLINNTHIHCIYIVSCMPSSLYMPVLAVTIPFRIDWLRKHYSDYRTTSEGYKALHAFQIFFGGSYMLSSHFCLARFHHLDLSILWWIKWRVWARWLGAAITARTEGLTMTLTCLKLIREIHVLQNVYSSFSLESRLPQMCE